MPKLRKAEDFNFGRRMFLAIDSMRNRKIGGASSKRPLQLQIKVPSAKSLIASRWFDLSPKPMGGQSDNSACYDRLAGPSE